MENDKASPLIKIESVSMCVMCGACVRVTSRDLVNVCICACVNSCTCTYGKMFFNMCMGVSAFVHTIRACRGFGT